MTFFRQWIAQRLESAPQPDARYWKRFARNLTLTMTQLESPEDQIQARTPAHAAHTTYSTHTHTQAATRHAQYRRSPITTGTLRS